MEETKIKSIEVEFRQEAKEVVALVEATENEMLFLQGKYGEELSWEKDKDEYLLNVCDTNAIYGQAQTPLSISIKVSENIINGKKVIFWSACSKVVDYRLIDVFLRQHYPNVQVKTDATNFHLIANLLGVQISASDGTIVCEVVKGVNPQSIKQISNNGDDHATKPNIPNIPNTAINPVINFLANIDKNVEEKLAKWSKAKKLTLAASLCLLGLLGATFTVFSSVKDAVNATAKSAKSVKVVNSPGMKQSLALSKVSKTRERLSSSDNNSADGEKIGNNESVKVAESWQSIESLLASTPQRRKQALTKLGLRNNGDYVIAAISLGCDSCIRLAKEINVGANSNDSNFNNDAKTSKLEPDNKQFGKQINKQSSSTPIILVTIASEPEVKAWQKEHLLSYPVQSISESMMNDLGIVFFPTLIKVNNGQVVGVSQSSSVLANSLAKQQTSTTKQTSIAKEVKEAKTSSSKTPIKPTK